MKKLRRRLIVTIVVLCVGVWWVLHEVASLDEIDWDLEQ